MSFDRSAEVIRRIQAYADASDDAALIVAIGTPGSKILLSGESEDTGQQWQDPGFMRAVSIGVGEIAGSWMSEDFDVLLGGSQVVLSEVPVTADCLQVFFNGVLARRVESAPVTGEYTWVEGSTTIQFASTVAWVHVAYARTY